MSVIEIRKAGDPVLKEKSKPVLKITKQTRALLDNLVETLRDANGAGLAAPQIGVSLRVIVIDIGDGLIELINPEIIESEGSETTTEGCLSFPGMWGEVERFTCVTVQGLDRHGNPVNLKGDGMLARAFQHEIDHLDGVLFVERAKSVFREHKE
ncbi:MAG TPA: peptide deformylase [Negativicutes bacterium]|nr:peptide deformylase [Negativicutes bacterium]